MENGKKPRGDLPTRNVRLLMELVSRVLNRDEGLPGMGAFYGPTGWGKSRAIISCAKTHQAYYVEMRSLWPRKYLLEMILSQMNIEPARTMAPMLAQIGRQLALSGRPLIIDEADILVARGMLEVVRDIYETSQGCVILVGEETLPGHIEKVERLHGRMLDWTAAQPTDLADARLFAAKHCPGIEVCDDFLNRVLEAAKGSARYVCTNLVRVAEFARMRNLERVDASAYTGALFTGRAPGRRRL